ncbi:MAG: DsbA family protein [Anaerolineae bacterium]
MVFGGLIYLAIRPSDTGSVKIETLESYCETNEGACVSQGSETAPVTIVEVSDFGCSHCRDFNLETAPLIEQRYIESGEVQLIVLPFALSSRTLPAANGGLCAADQGRYFEYHQAMFADFDAPDHLDRTGIERVAANTGLDMDQFSSCLSSSRYASRIQANGNAASGVGVSATPTFFINGQKVEGALPWATFQQRINTALGS